MGAALSCAGGGADAADAAAGPERRRASRAAAVTELRARGNGGPPRALPPGAAPTAEADWAFVAECLDKTLLCDALPPEARLRLAAATYERPVLAGGILIQEGAPAAAAGELYVVKSGEFEVLQRRRGAALRVNAKRRGDVFGEVSLLYDCPRSATVAATRDSAVWVLERAAFRRHARESREGAVRAAELFLNTVPALAGLAADERRALAGALEEAEFPAGAVVVRQGDPGDKFYLIKAGEAAVYVDADEEEAPEGGEGGGGGGGEGGGEAAAERPASGGGAPRPKRRRTKVNELFASDFFGEAALLADAPRAASVVAATPLSCLVLDRGTFDRVLGPLEPLLAREKSPAATSARAAALASGALPSRLPARVVLRRRRFSRSQGREVWEETVGVGHLDEVLALAPLPGAGGDGGLAAAAAAAAAAPSAGAAAAGAPTLTLVEGAVLGAGAFSRVCAAAVAGAPGRPYALKRLRKAAVAGCPEHVFCEQAVTRNLAHPLCVRCYASFQDRRHLYFLFDLCSGGDLMDVLAAEARLVRVRAPGAAGALLGRRARVLRGLPERAAAFYLGALVLALEHLHARRVVYRDLKPENVLLDAQGCVKLGDFGFAKALDAPGARTYTFCGTPGYVAPENVLAHGYGPSVDWWGLGVTAHVLLTGRQPFSSPATDDPMEIMRRIVDPGFEVRLPPYASPAARDLVARLLERRPSRRLGCGARGAADVRAHRFFAGLDWRALAAGRAAPPRLRGGRAGGAAAEAARRVAELAEGEARAPPPRESPEELAEAIAVFKDF